MYKSDSVKILYIILWSDKNPWPLLNDSERPGVHRIQNLLVHLYCMRCLDTIVKFSWWQLFSIHLFQSSQNISVTRERWEHAFCLCVGDVGWSRGIWFHSLPVAVWCYFRVFGCLWFVVVVCVVVGICSVRQNFLLRAGATFSACTNIPSDKCILLGAFPWEFLNVLELMIGTVKRSDGGVGT